MAQRFEYYSGSTDEQYKFYGSSNYCGQTFTPQIAHRITSVKLFVARFGASLGNLYVYIYNTSGHYPTGPALISGSIPASQVLQGAHSWIEIPLSGVYVVQAGMEYALHPKYPNGTSPSYSIGWYDDNSSPTYPRGMLFDNAPRSYKDFLFEEWGELLPGGKPMASDLVRNGLI